VTVAVAERLTIVTPFGVRFFDEALQEPVSDRLRVRVRPPGGRPLTARRNARGVWWVSDVPGLREIEQGTGTKAWWDAPPPQIACTVDVDDPAGRYLPCQFGVDVPHRRVLSDPCTPPLPRIGLGLGVPLFATPSRAVPPGMAAIRARLWDKTADEPAAGAVLEVRRSGLLPLIGRGLSADDGQVLVLLPWPPLAAQGGPGGTDALMAQSWTLDLKVRYQGSPSPPGLCARMSQSEAPVVDLAAPALAFSQELNVSSTGHSVLLVQP
jgi:hypothetical protein